MENLLDAGNIPHYEVIPEENDPTFHPGRTAKVLVDDTVIGVFGEIHPAVLENYGIGVRAYCAKFDLKTLTRLAVNEKKYKPLPKFPASTRDLSLVADEKLPIGQIEKVISEAIPHILEEIKFFDIYRGAQIPQGKKSVSYSLVLRAADRTLTVEECDDAVAKVLKALEGIQVFLRQ